MKSYSFAKLTHNEPAPAPLPPSTEPPASASEEQLALLQFRRLLADYRRAGYEYAQRIRQLMPH